MSVLMVGAKTDLLADQNQGLTPKIKCDGAKFSDFFSHHGYSFAESFMSPQNVLSYWVEVAS